jgi:hypothetical protein
VVVAIDCSAVRLMIKPNVSVVNVLCIIYSCHLLLGCLVVA